MIEKRKEPRYRISDRAYTIDWSAPRRLGEIIDISRSGMSFRCLHDHNGFKQMAELGIFSSIHNFFLKHIKFETLADIRLEAPPTSTIIMRRHSGRFLSQTDQQREELGEFIEHFSQSPAQSGS
jgi:hypothetical protein